MTGFETEGASEPMGMALDCLPCFVRQAVTVARMVSADASVRERVIREALAVLSETALDGSPVALAREFHRRIRGIIGGADPYRAEKDAQNRLALALLPELRAAIEAAADPVMTAARVAAAGNVIDMGAPGDISEDRIRETLLSASAMPLAGEGRGFRNAILSARRILYLTDNAGEIAFDRLFIEQLGPGRVTAAVRGGPVLNDATITDARAVGLDGLVEVIDNGSDAPGTLLEDCSPEFKRRFAAADLVLAKGQGNYETLGRHPKNILFLFKVKCPLIAELTGEPLGAHVVVPSGTGPNRAGRKDSLKEADP